MVRCFFLGLALLPQLPGPCCCPPCSIFLFGLALSLAYLNYRGLTVVGHTIMTAVLVILVPFIILTVLCIPDIEPSNWLKVSQMF